MTERKIQAAAQVGAQVDELMLRIKAEGGLAALQDVAQQELQQVTLSLSAVAQDDHSSFLKGFFRAYKDFSDRHIDTIELMLERLYAKWGLDDGTDFNKPFTPKTRKRLEVMLVWPLKNLLSAPRHRE